MLSYVEHFWKGMSKGGTRVTPRAVDDRLKVLDVELQEFQNELTCPVAGGETSFAFVPRVLKYQQYANDIEREKAVLDRFYERVSEDGTSKPEWFMWAISNMKLFI